MNRRKRWKIKNVILLVLAMFCYIIGIRTYNGLRENYQSVSVQLQGDGTTKKQVVTLLEEEKEKYSIGEGDTMDETNAAGEEAKVTTRVKKVPEITAYEMEEHKTVTNKKYGKEKATTKYLVYGNMQQILPLQIYRGNYVYENDYEGCILDKETAYELFGSMDILGQQVEVEETILQKRTGVTEGENSGTEDKQQQTTSSVKRVYYVRGILDTSHPVFMVQARSDQTTFHYLQLNYGDTERGREYVEQLQMIYPLGSSAVIVDQNLIVRLVGNVLFLPVLFVFVFFLIFFIRRIQLYGNGEEKLQERLRIMAGTELKKAFLLLALGITVVVTARQYGFFPLQYIPTKWSDFNSVGRTINTIQSHMEELNYMTPTIREVMMRKELGVLVGSVIAMVIFIWVLQERRQSKREQEEE
ncbi:ABC transporter permease [Anaerosporobacter faecicola]|uniref:ABC transporter permease n=1 Tax=Anaerosporobacter faecicola TaxID=2718714 RepID=UPI00143ACEC8|nr:ABC transporter permease [Anaerosporobacter faecicola]